MMLAVAGSECYRMADIGGRQGAIKTAWRFFWHSGEQSATMVIGSLSGALR